MSLLEHLGTVLQNDIHVQVTDLIVKLHSFQKRSPFFF
jgi:hypothetical protein